MLGTPAPARNHELQWGGYFMPAVVVLRANRLLLSLLLLLLLLLASGLAHGDFGSSGTALAAGSNPIVTENQQAGSANWQLGRSGFQTADDVNGQIKGYASATSVNKGQAINFFVTVNPAQTYAVDVYRMGWYGGLGGRLMQQAGGRSGSRQAACPTDATTGLTACAWSSSYTLNVPTTWTTGVYLALLTNAQNYQNYIVFVVRDDGRVAPISVQQGVNTYQAYNNYPDNHQSGKSLYTFNSYGANTVAGDPRAVKVSFDRPYALDGGAGHFLEWDQYLVHWLERSGYDLGYTTDVDTHTNGGRLLNPKAVLVMGHGEYWTRPMYDAVLAARDGGVNLAFFGANADYWQVRFESSAGGAANRVVVCYRDATLDPNSDPNLKTVNWRSAPLNRPEQQLIGVQYTSLLNSNYPYVVSNSSSWVYSGTGFNNGDSVPGIVGYEVDRNWSQYTQPPTSSQGESLLSQSPVTNSDGYSDVANASVYQAPSNAWVFATGTMSWSWALDRAGYIDARIQQTTTDVLTRFLSTGAATPTPTSVPTATPTRTPTPTPTNPPASSATNTPGSTSGYRSAVLADNPAGYWRLDEASGNAADSSGHGHTGTYNASGVTRAVSGAPIGDADPAAKFDGANGLVSVSGVGTFSATAPFSAEAWVNPSVFPANTWARILSQEDSTTNQPGWALYLDASVGTLSAARTDANTSDWVGGSTALPLNQWSYVVLTYDGATLRLYVNGQLTDTASSSRGLPASSAPLEIAASYGAGQLLTGSVDEPAIYTAALTPAQVTTHYQASKGG